MRRTLLTIGLLLAVCGVAAADPPPVIDSIVEAEHCGRFTVAPGGGEDLVDETAGNDYRIHVTVWADGDPVTTLAATDLWLWHPELSTCPGQFSQADDGTDENGHTTFSGTIFSGLVGDGQGGVDCDAAELYVFALGYILNDGQPACVATDSPDLNGDLEVGLADFARFATDFNCAYNGRPCDPCHDFSENGEVELADFALLAQYFNASVCP